eukprot:328536-Prymnesium_polylepis.1
MQPEARSVVGYSLDCLWATGFIIRQRLVAKSSDQRALLLHPPALSNNRSGHRCDGGRLLVDL